MGTALTESMLYPKRTFTESCVLTPPAVQRVKTSLDARECGELGLCMARFFQDKKLAVCVPSPDVCPCGPCIVHNIVHVVLEMIQSYLRIKAQIDSAALEVIFLERSLVAQLGFVLCA